MGRGRIHEYEGEHLAVRWDQDRCIHAAECVRSLGSVFDPDARPWISPDAAPAGEVTEAIRRCPTGALSYERTDGPAGPEPDMGPARLSISVDGPIYARGDIVLNEEDGEAVRRETRVALCRCGASANKPFCDNSHEQTGFEDAGGCEAAGESEDGVEGSLELTPLPDGPMLLRGHFVITSADRSSEYRAEKGALCRCGQSAKKPFCDGSHARTGFSSR